MESDWDQFNDRDVGVVAITAQKIDGMSRAREFVRKQGYRFPILFDQTRQVTKSYGLFHRVGLDAFRIARPAAILLDETSRIQWIGVAPNQTQWPRTAQILEAIEVSGKY